MPRLTEAAAHRLKPESLRRRTIGNGSGPLAPRVPELRLTLAYRPPLAWPALLEFLAARATPGAERVADGTWSRVVRIDGHTGVVRVHHPERTPGALHQNVVVLEADATLAPSLMALCARVEHLFDLAAEPNAITSHLVKAGFPAIRRPARGLRVPGAWDGFELALRAILGQQVSVSGARTLTGRLTSLFGEPLPMPVDGFTHLAPTPERLAEAGAQAIRRIGLPGSRAGTIHELARQVAGGHLSLAPDADVAATMSRLMGVKGIGPWTAEYIAMRALHWPDAFPASDLVLRRAAGGLTTAQLKKAADSWRPWRSYAAMHLWLRG